MKILVNNLFHGVLERGISIYTYNLGLGLVKLKHDAVVLTADSVPLSERMPRSIFNFFFVFWEQVVIPIRAVFYKRVIFPYNSASILLSRFSDKQLLIIHDFIPYERRFSLSLMYLKATVFIHSKYGRDVAFITPAVEAEALARGYFHNSRRFIIPNTFFGFEQDLAEQQRPEITGEYILLCSGSSENKDLSGALDLAALVGEFQVVVLGVPSKYTQNTTEARRVEFLPQLSSTSVANIYKFAKCVWVHSRSEGFGRSIVEGRLAGKPVIASDIEAFRAQDGRGVFLYDNRDDFARAWRCALSGDGNSSYVCTYNEEALTSLDRWVNS
jgi:glycosyltransferase involved in cell wall biosynthesis